MDIKTVLLLIAIISVAILAGAMMGSESTKTLIYKNCSLVGNYVLNDSRIIKCEPK